MIEHLAALVEKFSGATNQTQCLTHILNLVAKSILRQFEGPKKGKAVDDAAKELAADVDNDEASDGGSNEGNECDDGDNEDVDDNKEGLLDEDEMSMKEMVSEPERKCQTNPTCFDKGESTNINNLINNQQLFISFEVYHWLSRTCLLSFYLSSMRSWIILLSNNA